MGLKLVLFINGEETFDVYDYPLSKDVVITNPVEVYSRTYALNKSENFPDNVPTLHDFQHEYKIIWQDY